MCDATSLGDHEMCMEWIFWLCFTAMFYHEIVCRAHDLCRMFVVTVFMSIEFYCDNKKVR